jgi:hypothetical protein
LGQDLLNGRTVVTPTEAMNDVLAEGFSRASPLLIGAINRIGFATWPKTSPQEVAESKSTFGGTIGTTLLLNADLASSDEMLATILHEAAHAFEFLTEVAANNPNALEIWPEEVATKALALIARYRLVRGLDELWNSLHLSGTKEGYTQPYVGLKNYLGVSQDQARSAGAASPYGMVDASEDLAEYVATVEAPSGKTPGVCPVFDGVSELTPEIAIPYAKLTLLRSVSAITDVGFDVCVKDARIDAKAGIQFPGPGVSFTGGLRAGLATSEGKSYFRVLASGVNTYQMLVDVGLDSKEQSPLGLHRLDDIWLATLPLSPANGIYVSHDLPEKARAGASGFVLVTEASETRAEGAIFGLVLQNGFGLATDSWSYGTFAAP